MGRHGAARDGMGRHGTAWDGMGRHGTTWDGMGRHGAARDGTGTQKRMKETLNLGCGTEQSEPLPVSMHTQLHKRTEDKGPPVTLV